MDDAGHELIYILVPSKGRPLNIERLSESIQKTANQPDFIELVVAIDDQDELSYHYRTIAYQQGFTLLPIAFVPHRGCVFPLNYAASYSLHSSDITVFMGDDHLPETKGWDDRFRESLRTHLFCYGNDGIQEEKIPTAVGMRTDVIRTLGWMAPPTFQHLCVDLVWKDYGDALDSIEYLPDVKITHLHPAAGKAPLDEGYELVNSTTMVQKDSKEYFRWSREDRPGEIEKLRKLL